MKRREGGGEKEGEKMPGMDCGSEGETEVRCEKWIEKGGRWKRCVEERIRVREPSERRQD